MDNWRDYIDPLIKEHLEIIINEAVKQRSAYKKAKNTANAQIWCALAYMAKQNFELEQENKLLKKTMSDLNQKYRYLEKTLKDLFPQKKKRDENDKEDPAEALKSVLKKL